MPRTPNTMLRKLTGVSVDAKVGSFAINTSTGQQVITGIGFQPKAIIFFGNDLTADGVSADAVKLIGMAVSGSSRVSVSDLGEDNQATSDASMRLDNTHAITLISEADVVTLAADLETFDADGFTIDITTASGAAHIVNYIALGGPGLVNAAIKEISSPTSTGNQSYTGVGFRPDAVFALMTPRTTVPASSNALLLSAGFATGPLAQAVLSTRIGAVVSPQVNEQTQKTTRLIDISNGGAQFLAASLVTMGSDGFTLNWSTVQGTARLGYVLCLQGGHFKVGSFAQPTATGNQAITGLGFIPTAVVLMSWNKAASASILEDSRFSFGAGTGPTERACIWQGDQDNVNPTQSNSDLDQTKIIKMLAHADTPTVDAAADLASLDADGFTLDWTAADATARQILYLAVGGVPVRTAAGTRTLVTSPARTAA